MKMLVFCQCFARINDETTFIFQILVCTIFLFICFASCMDHETTREKRTLGLLEKIFGHKNHYGGFNSYEHGPPNHVVVHHHRPTIVEHIYH